MQLLATLKAMVTRLAGEVEGFKSSIEELRAAGRVEAMEDLMTGLLGELARPPPCPLSSYLCFERSVLPRCGLEDGRGLVQGDCVLIAVMSASLVGF